MTKEKIDTYAIVTNRIIASLEAGTIPWKKPWNSSMPKNIASKKEYRGINTMLLGMGEYASPYWGTFKQWTDAHGTVRKGEKSTPIVFWKFLTVEDKKTKGKDKIVPMLRYYNVFNAEQIDFAEGFTAPVEGKIEFSPIEACEAILAGYSDMPEIEKSGSAWYSPMRDKLGMPKKESFHSVAEYYSTLFHELTHSTGHKSRLARFDLQRDNMHFGSEDYSKEELVAELGASFLAFETGIDMQTAQNSDAYIAGWLKVLKGDKKFITSAGGQAQKAVDYIKGIKPEPVQVDAEFVEAVAE